MDLSFVSGHDFSRALESQQGMGFSPWFFRSFVLAGRGYTGYGKSLRALTLRD